MKSFYSTVIGVLVVASITSCKKEEPIPPSTPSHVYQTEQPFVWIQLASCPLNLGPLNGYFTASGTGKVYIGLGFDNNNQILTNQIYQYDRSSNTWFQIPVFPGGARMDVGAFVINDNLYICGGKDSVIKNDLWCYDPVQQQWSQKANMPGAGKYSAASCGKGTNGFIMGGFDSNGTAEMSCYKYQSLNDTWSTFATLPGPYAGRTPLIVNNYIYLISNSNYSYKYSGGTWVNEYLTGPFNTPFSDIFFNHSNSIYGVNKSTSSMDFEGCVYSDVVYSLDVSSNFWNQEQGFCNDARLNAVNEIFEIDTTLYLLEKYTSKLYEIRFPQ